MAATLAATPRELYLGHVPEVSYLSYVKSNQSVVINVKVQFDPRV